LNTSATTKIGGDGGITEVVQRQFQLNRKDEFIKAFVQEAMARVIRPLESQSTEQEEPNTPSDW
jgi:hypothetical protein